MSQEELKARLLQKKMDMIDQEPVMTVADWKSLANHYRDENLRQAREIEKLQQGIRNHKEELRRVRQGIGNE